jgi:hypothetical protein
MHFVAPTGEPLEHGYVKIHEERGDACVREFYCGKSTCRVTSLAPGRYRFEYHPKDQHLAPAAVRVALPSAAPIEVRCARGARVTGTVLGADTKGFRVTWLGRANGYDAGGPTGAEWDGQAEPAAEVVDGRFELLGLTPQSGGLYVHKTGDPRCAYVPGVLPGTESLALHLERGYTIRGTVAGFDPARHDRVRAVRGAISVSAEVAPDASFAIVGLPPGRFRVEVLTRERTETLVVGVTADVEAGAEGVRVRAR